MHAGATRLGLICCSPRLIWPKAALPYHHAWRGLWREMPKDWRALHLRRRIFCQMDSPWLKARSCRTLTTPKHWRPWPRTARARSMRWAIAVSGPKSLMPSKMRLAIPVI